MTDHLTTTDKLAAAFAALRAYGCQNLNELDALLGSTDTVGWLSWDNLADLIIDTLRGKASRAIRVLIGDE